MNAEPTAADASWPALAARLRPFIRARVHCDEDADDVLQDVLLRMYRGLPALQHADRLGPWMFQVARTALADHGRARARHPLTAAEAPERDPEHDGAAPGDGDGDGDAVAADVARALDVFVAALPEAYREAITLTDLEGRTQREAAALLGVSLSGVKSRVQRGRARLRGMLEACCEVAVDARGKLIACEPRPEGPAPPGCCP